MSAAGDVWHRDSQESLLGREHVRNVWPELGKALDAETPSDVLPERRCIYLSFGVQYSREPHPVLTVGPRLPNGYLTVEYGLGSDGLWTTARERARVTAWTFLDKGSYAFDSDLPPDHDNEGKRWYPAGEVARMVLP